MAVPKVFISSTCFDLSEIREQLNTFVKTFGFDPVLSEHGDVFYHPDLHTHDACVHEVSNCQLFILIIGGRFGGKYVKDKNKSITNAEYEAAKLSKIPIFTYIKKGVLDNHHLYNENKSHDFINEITFPAIDKKEDSKNIFAFIDNVRRSPTNNAFEGFDNFNDIEKHLRKQWAGMFFDFLKTKEVKSQIEATTNLIKGLENSNSKLEDLVKSLYLSSVEDKGKAENSISEIEITNNVRNFFSEAVNFNGILITRRILNTDKKVSLLKISKISPKNMKWNDYLLKIGFFTDIYIEDCDVYFSFESNNFSATKRMKIEESHNIYSKLFDNGILLSTPEQRLKEIQKLMV